jgi:hypothetical protein
MGCEGAWRVEFMIRNDEKENHPSEAAQFTEEASMVCWQPADDI